MFLQKLGSLCLGIISIVAFHAETGAQTRLLVGRSSSGDIQTYDAQTGHLLGTFASGFGNFLGPTGAVARGPNGNLFLPAQQSNGDTFVELDVHTGAVVNTLVNGSIFSQIGAGPTGVALAPNNDLFTHVPGTAINLHPRILRFDGSMGAFLGVFAHTDGDLEVATGLVIAPNNDLYVTGSGTNGMVVLRYNGQDGSLVRQVDSFSGGRVPLALTFGPDGNLYVLIRINNGGLEVRRYNGQTDAFIDLFVASTHNDPLDMDFGPDGNLYISRGSGFPIGNTDMSVLRFDGQTGVLIDEFIPPGIIGDLPIFLIFTPAVTAQTLIPISDNRSVDVFVLSDCLGETSSSDAANGFAPFNSMVQVDQPCDVVSGHATASQQSLVGTTSLSGSGSISMQTVGFAISWADSSYRVTFELPVVNNLSRFMLNGQFNTQTVTPDPNANGFVNAGFSITGPGGQTIISGSGPVVSETGVLLPGTYTINAGSNAFIDDSMSPHFMADGTFAFTLDISILGDVDADGDADFADLDALVAVLTGMPLDPAHVATSDLDGNGSADGNDIQLMVDALLFVPPPPPPPPPPPVSSVTYTPGPTVSNCPFSFTVAAVTGSTFNPNVTAKLTQAGQPDIPASSITFTDSTFFEANFDDLSIAASGTWQLEVANPGTTFTVAADVLTVIQCPPVNSVTYTPGPTVSNCPFSFTVAGVTGNSFDPSVTAKLTQAGQADIPASSITFTDSTFFEANFDDLSIAAPGTWQLEVANPGTAFTVATDALTVIQCP